MAQATDQEVVDAMFDRHMKQLTTDVQETEAAAAVAAIQPISVS